jgi:hypothetical protein
MLCALNVSGCHNGSIRTVQRPRFLNNPFRRQAIVVNPGLEAVETPGSVVVQQQGSATVTQQAGEPPVTTLEPRQGSSVTSVVPSFDDAQQPIGEGAKTRIDGTRSGATQSDAKSIMNSLAPPAEAPQVIMEAPPLGAGGSSGKSPSLAPPIDSSTSRAGGQTQEEPRLEAIEPRKGGSGSSAPADSSKDAKTPKTSAWRSPKFGDLNSRTTYQASSRQPIEPETSKIGTID